MTEDNIWKKAEYVWKVGAKELENLSDSIDKNKFVLAVKTIATCRGRIVTAGVGTSGAAAKKIAHSLSCIERPSFFLDPGDAVQMLGIIETDLEPMSVSR